MAARTIHLSAGHQEAYSLVKSLLSEFKFVIIHEESREDGFHIIAVNKKRTSQLTISMMSLIGGFISRKRTGLELFALERGGALIVELRSSPYLSSIDMEAVVEDQEERDRCRRAIELFGGRILKGLSRDPQSL